MQATLDIVSSDAFTRDKIEAQQIAGEYVTRYIDPSFTVADGAFFHSKPLGREIWQFVICCAHAPLDAIEVDPQTGAVIPLTDDKICVIREKSCVAAARVRGILPMDRQGYVLAEYARRQADSYLGTKVSLFYSATAGLFVPLAASRDASSSGAIWQFSIQMRLPRFGALGSIGTINVDAQTGAVIPLSNQQIKQIRERADALVEFRTQTATA